MSSIGMNNRRGFLKSLTVGGGALLLPACTKAPTSMDESVALSTPPKPTLPDHLNPSNFIIHNKVPLALETRRSKIGSGVITPASLFFVRNNLPMPPAEIVSHPDAWELAVQGVQREGTLSLAELKGLGLQTESSVIQCSGNGRAFFGHDPSGSNWGVGAAGCSMWTGIRVSTLAAHLGGAVATAKFLTSTGGEELPEGVERNDVVVERSIPIEKALGDTLLAWEMNGAPIPITHGGPLRLIVPGYYGCNSIKYVRAIAFAERESEAEIHRTGYRMRPIGVPGSPDQPSMWRMAVKSWVNGPGADDTPVLAGSVTFYGVALSGERGIRKVEVSLDEGNTWTDARLEGPDLGPNAWRAFSYTVELPVGKHTIVSRATDTKGDAQPRTRVENERGYGHNSWLEAALTVNLVDVLPDVMPSAEASFEVAEAPTAKKEVTLSEAGEEGRVVFTEAAQPSCGICHTVSNAETQGIVGPNLDDMKPDKQDVESAVTNGVGAMPSYRDVLTPKQIQDVAEYIVEVTR